MKTAILAILLCLGIVSANMLDDHLTAVKKGLSRVALETQMCPYMPAADAKTLLKEWYEMSVACTEATESMWQSYCQQFYISEGGDCNAATKENKAMIMSNMKICKII